MKTSFAALLALGLIPSLDSGLAAMAKSGLEPLFLDAHPKLQAQARPAETHAQRSRVVQLNPRLLQSGLDSLQQPGTRLTANLFEDQEHVVVVDKVEVKGSDEFVCFGRVEGHPDSYVILASVDEAMAGTITLLGQAPFQVQYLGDGLHRINEVALSPMGWRRTAENESVNRGTPGTSELSEFEAAAVTAGIGRDEFAPAAAEAVPARSGIGLQGFTSIPNTNAQPVIIDFLLLYTPKALAGAGGEAGINALMDFAIAQANFCYANSQVNVRWNIVYKGLINYNDSGNVLTDAGWVQSSASALRSAYRADLALLITELDTVGYSGAASGWGGAFVRSYVTADHLVVHEVSHLLGAGHDRLTCQNQPGNCGAKYAYSYGYRFLADGVTYMDVMAYEPGIIIPYFSNPNVLFRGVPTGVPAGQPNAADNARTINTYAPTVANFMRATNRFEFAASRYKITESADSLAVEVLRSGDTNGTATVECVTVSGTATAGTDFVATTNLVTFAPGEVRQMVTLTILDDDLAEGDETFVVALRKPQAGTALGLQSSTTVVIQDDEVFFHFATDKIMVPEGADAMEMPVLRGGNTNQNVSVSFSVAEGTAQAGTDFTAQAGVLAFAPGEREKTIRLEILDDSFVEVDETFVLTLEQPSQGAVAGPGSLTVTIADDERPGSLDRPFAVDSGLNGFAGAVAVAADGRILCGGRFTEANGQLPASLVRFAPDGSLDSTFSPVRVSIALTPEPGDIPSFISSLILQPDGKILLGGMFGSVNGTLRTSIARLNADGSMDATFAPTPGPNSELGFWAGDGANALVLLPNGKILMGGAFWSVNGVARGIVARLNADGSLDETFAAKPDSSKNGWAALALAVQADGKVLVGMNGVAFEGGNGYLARLNADGTRDRTFRGSPNGPVNEIAALPNGQLLIAGGFTSPKPKLARLNADGAVDSTFKPTPAPNGNILDLVVLPDGRILIAGGFTSVGGKSRNYVARLNPDGSLDATFDAGLGPNDQVKALAVQADGGVILGGMFTAVNGQPRTYLARLRSDGTQPTFAAPTMLATGDLGMKLFGNAQATYGLESSSDLLTWLPVWTNTFTGTSWEWTEPSAAMIGRRFYRVHQVVP